MTALVTRPLRRDEVETVWSIDRSEVIERIYVMRDGALELKPAFFDVRGWPPNEDAIYTPQLYAAFDRGATFTGVFDGAQLAAVAVVDTKPVGVARDLVQLLFLHVGRLYRDRGLGAELFEQARGIARERGARGLYVSATPSEHTVRFYTRMGCRVLAEPDPELFADEPEDIHFECPV
ncbi:MAG: hypothetical protein RLZZ387_5747 [Chloroflexota bacterium]|jgi:predicted N-acetyltransferase YhbS